LIIGWGFLGAAIGDRLLALGVSVAGLTRSPTECADQSEAAGAHITIGDAARPGVVADLIEHADHVVFSVGGLSPPATADRPSDAAVKMLIPLLTLLEALAQRPHIALTYISSGGTVYGNPGRLPVSETDPTAPISPYGALHLACEDFAQTYSRRCGIRLQIIRCANVYGPRQGSGGDQGAVAIFLERIEHGLPLRIFGDGSALRDYVFVDDVAEVVARIIIDRLDTGVVNVGAGRGLTVLEIADAISDLVGRRADIEFVPDRGFDVREVVLDISRLKSFMSYTPTDFVQGLRATAATSRAAETPPV
jgi:UDP-glucose 4-epimerase